MDLRKHRLPIAIGLLVLLGGGTVLALSRRDAPSASTDATEAPDLPAIERDAVRALEITRPGGETIRVEKRGDEWRVVAPIDAEVEASTINGALDKLTSLEVTGVAATRAKNHERLQVDAAHGVHVVAHGESGPLIDLWIGGFRSGSTLVRLEGEDAVLAVRGSIKHAFDKELKEWRNRRVVNEDPAHVRAVAFDLGERQLRFERNAENEWVQAAGQPSIERFSASKVQSIVSTLARMRATDFAAPDVDEAATGLATPVATVTLTIAEPPAAQADGESAEAEGGGEATATSAEPAAAEPAAAPATRTIVLRLGGSAGEGGAAYVQREGNDLVYTVSSYVAERMKPELDAFQASESSAAADAPEPSGDGAEQQIPPELLQQLQQQMQQHGGH